MVIAEGVPPPPPSSPPPAPPAPQAESPARARTKPLATTPRRSRRRGNRGTAVELVVRMARPLRRLATSPPGLATRRHAGPIGGIPRRTLGATSRGSTCVTADSVGICVHMRCPSGAGGPPKTAATPRRGVREARPPSRPAFPRRTRPAARGEAPPTSPGGGGGERALRRRTPGRAPWGPAPCGGPRSGTRRRLGGGGLTRRCGRPRRAGPGRGRGPGRPRRRGSARPAGARFPRSASGPPSRRSRRGRRRTPRRP